MVFGITRKKRIEFYLNGQPMEPARQLTIQNGTDDDVRSIEARLVQPDVLITLTPSPNRRQTISSRAVAFIDVQETSDLSTAFVELYQDATGLLFLRDPEQKHAYAVVPQTDKYPSTFGSDAHYMIEEEWTPDEESDPGRPLDGLTLIATYRHKLSQIELVWKDGDEPLPVAGAHGRQYIGAATIENLADLRVRKHG